MQLSSRRPWSMSGIGPPCVITGVMREATTGSAGPVDFETATERRRRGLDAPAWAETDADDAIAEASRTDPAAFRILYERHWLSVYRYLRARTGRDDDAADLAATTFERALAGVRGYRQGSSGLRAWLLRIARNAAIDASRRRHPVEPIESIETMGTIGTARLAEPGPEALLLDAERSRELRASVATLPDVQREAIALRYAAGLSAREIGAVLGKTEAATQKLLTRALARLKESYREWE